MPRCQRTFYGLGEGRVAAGVGSRRWVCGHCPDAETYETLRDPNLLNYAARSFRRCAQWFGAPGDAARPTVLVLGLRPECVHEPGERRYDLYLQRDTDPWQMRLQIGHEMFHRVCSQGRIFHWTHEMLACLVSVRLLREHGLNDYAGQTERQWLAEAPRLSPVALRAVDLWATPAYPPGFYGRAYATAAALEAAVGWEHLRPLARFGLRDFRAGAAAGGGEAPDVAAWRARLPAPLRTRADAVLQFDQQEPAPPGPKAPMALPSDDDPANDKTVPAAAPPAAARPLL
jgi:hypothetical protein